MVSGLVARVKQLRVAWVRRSPIDSGGNRQQVTHSHQVVGRGREGEGPNNPGDSTMTSLAQAGDRLEPAEDLFHSFAPQLTESVAGVASAASVDCAVDLLCNVWCDSILPQSAHQLLLIVTLVGAERDPTLARDLCRHRLSRRRLGDAAGLSQAGVDHQAVAGLPRSAAPATQTGVVVR